MQHEIRREDEPLLPRAGDRPFFGRCLLYFTGGQLCMILFVAFSMHLARLNLFKEWVDLAINTLQVDVLFTLGTLLSVLAAAFWTISLFTAGLGCSGCIFFAAAVFAAATLAWSSLLRLAQSHGLAVTCPPNHQRANGAICEGFARSAFTVWQWTPIGIFQELQRTLQQPWILLFARSDQGREHTMLPQHWREIFIGSVFWLSFGICLCMLPSLLLGRVLAEHPARFRIIFWCLALLSIVSSTYLAFLITTEPCQWFWSFLTSPYIKLIRHSSDMHRSGKTVDSEVETDPIFVEEWLCLFASIWILFRMLYLVAVTQLEQWGAKQQFEESLRHAIAHPFRADLERGFADVRPAAEAALWGRPEVVEKDAPTIDAAQTLESLAAEDATLQPRYTAEDTSLRGAETLTTSDSMLGDLMTKRDALISARRRYLVEQAGGDAALPSLLHVHLRRDLLLEDTWQIMMDRPIVELLAPNVLVEFVGEGGVDVGGVTRDWFDSVARTLSEDSAAPIDGLFALANDGTLLPRPVSLSCLDLSAASTAPPPGEDEDEVARLRALLAAGRFLALAVLSARPIPLSLGSVVCKYLLQRPVGMDDVRRLDPDFYRCRVEAILKPGGVTEMEEALGLGQNLTFMSAPTERQPEPDELTVGGADKRVTENNKVEYVQLLCEAYLCGGIRRELRCLLQGFWDLLPLEVLQEVKISPQELSVLISGIRDLDPQEWRRHSTDANLFLTSTTLEGSNTSQVLDWFWEIVREDLTPEQRCLLLHFATGSSRLPPGGFPELQPSFSVEVTSSSSAVHLPHAHTCINRLVLHNYPSKAALHEKLMLALSTEGFAFA